MKVAALILLFVGACSVEPCQSGQTVDELGFCVPVTAGAGGSEAGAPSEASAGASGETGEAGAAACEMPSEFGDECTESSDCRCDINYCALQPGATTGVCTRTGCLEDPSICPDEWQCLDLSVFDPELPAICVPPN